MATPVAAPPSRPRAIPALTGLRFLAALAVVLFHMRLTMGTAVTLPAGLDALVDAGYVGVTLFFVLSGFILAYNYFDARTGMLAFLWARFARVVPVYLLSLAVALPLFVAEHQHHRRTLLLGGLSTVALLQSWNPAWAATFNPPGWSLSNEAFFYLAFPFVLPLARRSTDRDLALASGIAWVLALAAPLAYLRLAPDGLGAAATTATGSWWLDAVKFWPPLHLASFLMGVALGVRERRRPGALAPWAEPLVWGAALVTLVVIATRALPYPVQHTVGLAPLAAAWIAGLVGSRGPIVRALGHPHMVRLGEASYALYLLHVPLMVHAVRLAPRLGVDTRTPAFAAAYLLGAIALSWLTLVAVEEPARRALRAWGPRA